MHAGRSARTSGDAQTRVVRIDDKSELGHRIDQRLCAAPVEADDQERPPGREPEAARAKRPRALDQRLESNRLDFAEGRRRADDDRCAEFAHAEDVTQRSASLRTDARLRLATRLCKHGGSAGPLDQRAHPPRRRFASAGKGEERPAEPRRDIAGLGRRALRSQRIVAGKKHRERPIARRFKADIRIDVAKRQAAMRVEDEAELGRQPAQAPRPP